ncbi:MAG: hypothetical protein KIT24_07410 [Phycisphaeraceae bacterium]|nr:hypothetical protein [Phycisphaeraceae bacterium]
MCQVSKLVLAAGAAFGLAQVAKAQTIDWAAAVNGNWSNAANWDPMNVPDTASENARFNVNGTYTVTIDGSFGIGSLQQTIGNVRLDLPAGRIFTINGPTYNNRGLLVINPTNGALQTTLHYAASTNITGNGITRLGGSSNRAIVSSGAGATVTNGANHRFEGFGLISAAIINNGTVDANVNSNTLSLLTSPMTNNALFRASGGGQLDISNITVTQGAGGLIQANGGTVSTSGTSGIVGGTVEGVSPSTVNVGGNSTFTSVTTEGLVRINGGSNLLVQGTGLTNNGTLTVNPTNAALETRLRFDQAGALDGTGEVMLAGSTNRSILDAVNDTAIVTQGSQHAIRGIGQVRAGLVNNGLVRSDIAGQVLRLDTHPKVNNSVMEAAGGAFLDFGSGVTQSPSGVIRADDGTVRFQVGSSVSGGQVSSSGSGLVLVQSSVPMDGVTTDALLDVSAGANMRVTGGLTNTGMITLNPTNIAIETRLRVEDASTISGNGEIRLAASDNRAILDTLAPGVLTQGASHRVHGFGQVHAAMVNNGTIAADVDGRVLRLHVNNKTNNALMHAEGNGSLVVSGITITQGAGGVIEATDGFVGFESAVVHGGVVRALAGRFWQASGNTTFRDVSTSGAGQVPGGANLLVVGSGLVNTGLITINPTGAGVETRLRFDESGSLSGAGEVRLAGIANRAILDSNVGVAVTHASPHLVTGFGQVRAAMTNNSTMRGNVSGQTLELLTNAKTNTGIIEAIGGGGVQVSGITVTQSGGGVIRNDGGTVTLTNSTITGGAVQGVGGSVVGYTGFNFLSGTTLSGEHRVAFGSNLRLQGSITNNGIIDVNPTNVGSETRLQFDAAGTIGGTGEVRLSGVANRSILEANAVTGTLGPGQTLTGIGQTRGSFHFQGTLAPGLSAGTIDVLNGTINLANSSMYDWEVSTASVFDRLTGNATWNLDGTVQVTHLTGFTPVLNQRFVILQGSAVHGLFDNLVAPDLGGVEWKLVYFPNKVELQVRCKADLSGSSDPSDPNYGVPDGVLDAADFFYYLDLFVSQDPRADLSGSSDPMDPAYGVKDGVVDASDFFFFLDIFTGVCG